MGTTVRTGERLAVVVLVLELEVVVSEEDERLGFGARIGRSGSGIGGRRSRTFGVGIYDAGPFFIGM